jgi:hypothetical protein
LTVKVSFSAAWNGGTIHAEADSVVELEKIVRELRRGIRFESGGPTSRSSATSTEQNAQEFPQILDAVGCADAIRKLLMTPWGKAEARTEAELTSAMGANALHYGHGTISGLLTSLTKRGELRRLKKGRNYAYLVSRLQEKPPDMDHLRQ